MRITRVRPCRFPFVRRSLLRLPVRQTVNSVVVWDLDENRVVALANHIGSPSSSLPMAVFFADERSKIRIYSVLLTFEMD